MTHPDLPPGWGKINGEDHPDTTIANAAKIAERARCATICEGWLEQFAKTDIKYTSAREYASDAVKDILDAIREGRDPRG